METESTNIENEVIVKYPALYEAKENIAKADLLKVQICSKTSGLAPSSTKAGEIEIEKLQKELLESRQTAERLLNNLRSNQALAARP